MKKSHTILLLSLLLIGSTAKAQFNKPLQSPRNRVNSNEARYNIGLVGGLTTTQWFHFGGTETNYRHSMNISPVAGLYIERMLTNGNSIGLEGLYAMRNTQMSYDVANLPVAINESKDFYRQLDVDYQEVDVQVPFTHYFGRRNLRPFVYAAPRVSIPLSGQMIWQKKEILDYGTPDQHYSETGATIDTVEMNAQNTRQFNVGLVVGGGFL